MSHETPKPFKLPPEVEAEARRTGQRLLTPRQQKKAARLRRDEKIANLAVREPRSETGKSSKKIAVRLARPLVRRLDASYDNYAAGVQEKANKAAKKHYEKHKEAYQTHALIDDARRTEVKEKMEALLNASPMDMAALAISQGRSPREVATIWQHTNERQAANKEDSRDGREAGIRALERVPGTDPVLALADGHPEDIPKSGWMVTSNVTPGYAGRIDIYRYKEGQLEFKEPSDSRERHGEVRVHFGVNGGDRHTLAYENAAFPNKDTEPYDRMSPTSYTGLSFSDTDIVPLSNGGRLLDQKAAMGTYPNGINLFTSMDWRDFGRDTMREHSSDFPVNRVASSQAELSQVLGGIGQGMGLGPEDIDTMLGTVDQKISPAQ